MKMTTTMDAPPIWDSREFRSFPQKLITKKQCKDHHKKLFIPLHTFEVHVFPVLVRRIESQGNEAHRAGVRLFRR
jgi:hypothetical protein